jgi:hypothetical protein
MEVFCLKKIVSLMLSVVLCLAMGVTVSAEESSTQTVADKLQSVEKFMYGTEQAGALVTRLDNLEKDVLGQQTSGAVMSRVDNVYNAIEGVPTDGSLSIASKLNAVEWQFADRMSTEPAKTRIETLEQIMNGASNTTGSLLGRINALTATAFAAGSITGNKVVLPKDSLLKVKFMNDISSKTNQMGEQIDFVVDDNVYVGETLVLPKGAKGYGTIKKIVPARSFGRDARIDLDFSHVIAMDGSRVPVYVGELAKQEAKTAAGAAGASIGGMIIFGPIGVVGGVFVKGQSVTIPAGTNTFVQVTRDIEVNGIIQSGGGVVVPKANVLAPATKSQSNTAAKAHSNAAAVNTEHENPVTTVNADHATDNKKSFARILNKKV